MLSRSDFIHLHYTNRSADVYPYSDVYAPMENIPIVTAATAFYHPDDNTYILVFHESLYYSTKIRHSLINPNQVRHCGLDFFDNPGSDDNLYMEIDDGLHVLLRIIGTKCVFDSRAPTLRSSMNVCDLKSQAVRNGIQSQLT